DVARAVGAIAEIAILDILLVDAGALHGMLDGMRRHAHGRGDVESAAAGFREPGARIGNDDGFTHVSLPFRIAGYGVSWSQPTQILPGATKICAANGNAAPPRGMRRLVPQIGICCTS